MKKYLTLFILALTVLTMSIPAFAGEAVCSQYGYHQMEAIGLANVEDPTGYVHMNWQLYQCDCNDVFVCSGYPHAGGSILKYYYGSQLYKDAGISESIEDSQLQVQKIFCHTDSYYKYTTKTSLSGYEFIRNNN